MDLNIGQMEQFSKVQIDCLEMMLGLIAYDKEEAAKGNITATNTKLVEAFIDTQKKALQAFIDLLEKHKPALQAIQEEARKKAETERKEKERAHKIKEDIKKAIKEEGSLFACSEPATIEVEEPAEEPLLGEYDIEENDCDDDDET
ncbi:hypothetical protein [Phascolarctobacterium sp.]